MIPSTLTEILDALEVRHEVNSDVTVVYVGDKNHGNRVKGHVFRRIGLQPDKVGLRTLWYKTTMEA